MVLRIRVNVLPSLLLSILVSCQLFPADTVSAPPDAVPELLRRVDEYLSRIRITKTTFRNDGTIVPIGSFKPTDDSTLDDECKARRIAVKRAVMHAWDGYAQQAWGFDELKPVSGKGTNSFAAGLGTTIVDSLSTLYLMGGLDGRYEKARDWVANKLDFSRVGRVIVFETVIRVLGGLLSMYHLSGDEMYARKAEELGARLASSFESPSGLPWPRAFLNDSRRRESHEALADSAYLAEVGSVQLELRALAHHSREPLLHLLRKRAEAVITRLQTATSHAARLQKPHDVLLPFALSLSSGRYATNMVTLGAPADSYFEYLVKMWVQGGRREKRFWDLFARVMDAVDAVASYKSSKGDVIVRDVLPDADGRIIRFQHKMDHFACYIPGMIVLGLDGLGDDEGERRAKWEGIAEDLTETCYKMYERSPTGLAGENIRLSDDDRWRMDGGYHLRPEAVEAFFYMWRHTKKQRYRDYAWTVFQNIERQCRMKDGGYAVIKNARSRHPRKADIMHSFLIAETFKYIFLIFGPDDELSLDTWVFNTEAHPLLITPGLETLEGSKKSESCEATTCKAPPPAKDAEANKGERASDVNTAHEEL